MLSALSLVEVKTTLRLSDALLDRYKHLAIDKKTTINGLIINAMEEYLKKIDSNGKSKK